MSVRARSTVSISAPAKINVGLEILGKRADGFHEIRTLMAMLEFGDHLSLSTAPESAVHGVPGGGDRNNLIFQAIEVFRRTGEMTTGVRVSATKHIPMAAGLGGASADAAATLRALNAMASAPRPDEVLRDIAASLGSDVPFFLGSPLALASGTGTDLSPLSPVPFDVFLVVPHLTIPNKTGTLYTMLDPSDFSDGSLIEDGARSLAKGHLPGQHALANAFERPLYALAPSLATLRQTLETLDCVSIGLSGAGPSHYVVPLPGRAQQAERELHALMPPPTRIIRTSSRLLGLHTELRSSLEQA